MLAIVASRPILRSAVDALAKTSARNNSHYQGQVSGPPRVRISFPEKVTHGIIIFIGCTIIPTWVTVNIPKYSPQDADDE